MKTRRKLIAIVLSVVLIIAMLATPVFASTITESNHLTPGADIDSITLSGVSSYTSMRTDENYTAWGYTNTRYTYNITVPASTADNAQLTIVFSPATGTVVSTIPAAGPIQYFGPMITNNASNSYYVNLTNGTGSLTVYVHRGLGNTPPVYGKYDTYMFNFEKGYPVSISTGDPVYIAWDTQTPTTGTVSHRGTATTWPTDFTLWVENPGNSNTISQTYTPSGQTTPTTDTIQSAYHNGTNYAFTVPFKSVVSTLTVVSGNTTYTISIPANTSSSPVAAGTSPSAVVSYLPIGQFATGSGWGSASGKFVNKTSLDSTGVSLGALGGYIEFDFGAGGIVNDPKNPYGVDFVIYGNAFDGNPEAGAVQVGWEHDGTVTWYELAGARYYDAVPDSVEENSGFSNAYSGTLRNSDVTYTLKNNGIRVDATDGTVTLTSKKFTSSTSWWPTVAHYSEFTNYSTDPNGNAHTDNNVTVAYGGDTTNSTLVFGGVTAITDSNDNAFYPFGYADVTPNGSPSHYGVAVNPYTAYTSTKTGGDGFDLEWAVNIATGEPLTEAEFYVPDGNGNPTSILKPFRYVRVYSAVLDNGTFGETSAEICGIFSAYHTNTASVGRSDTPTDISFKIQNSNYVTLETLQPSIPSNRGIATYINTIIERMNFWNSSSLEVSITATSGANVYVNGVRLDQTSTSGTNGIYTGTVAAPVSGQYIRVIVQSGTEAPYLCVFK